MKTELTSTTGTVTGKLEVAAFIKESYSKYDAVFIVDSSHELNDYLQYTLLTKNEIRIYLSSALAENILV